MSGRKKEPVKVRLTRYCTQLGDGSLRTDGKVVYCDACEGVIHSDKKSLVKQHISTQSHTENVDKRKESKRPRQELLVDAMQKAQYVKSAQVQFSKDLCRAFLEANYTFLVDAISQLESAQLSLCEALRILDDARIRINAVDGQRAEIMKQKFRDVFGQNQGLNTLRSVATVLRGETVSAFVRPTSAGRRRRSTSDAKERRS